MANHVLCLGDEMTEISHAAYKAVQAMYKSVFCSFCQIPCDDRAFFVMEYSLIRTQFFFIEGPINPFKRCLDLQPCTQSPSCSPLTKLLDNKPCLSSRYYSHLCSSSLALQQQGSLLRVAFQRGNGYASCRLHYEFLAHDLIYWHCV